VLHSLIPPLRNSKCKTLEKLRKICYRVTVRRQFAVTAIYQHIKGSVLFCFSEKKLNQAAITAEAVWLSVLVTLYAKNAGLFQKTEVAGLFIMSRQEENLNMRGISKLPIFLPALMIYLTMRSNVSKLSKQGNMFKAG